MFDPCIAHQNLSNKIKHLEATLGAFSLVLSSMVTAYYFYEIFQAFFIDFLAGAEGSAGAGKLSALLERCRFVLSKARTAEYLVQKQK